MVTVQACQLGEYDLKILGFQTPLTLALWYEELNGWRWPPELGEEEPPKHEREADGLFHLETTKRNAIMKWISARITLKFLLRIHNSELGRGRSKMSDEEFETWWKQDHGLMSHQIDLPGGVLGVLCGQHSTQQ